MRKSLTINNYQASATGLATDPGRGRGGCCFQFLLYLIWVVPHRIFLQAGFGVFHDLPTSCAGWPGGGRPAIHLEAIVL